MPAAAAPLKPASREIGKALNLAAAAKETARRHQPEVLGQDVDANHCFADFLLTVKEVGMGNRATQLAAARKLETVYKTAMLETSGVNGGYVVPPEMRDQIMRDIFGLAVVRPRATVIPMKSLVMYLPTLDATTVPAAKGTAPFWGGLLMQFALEGESLAESEPQFRQVTLSVSQLGGYALCSNPLMQDGLAIEQWLRTTFARSAAWYEDYYFLNGNGAGQPQGIITAGASLLVNRNTVGHFKIQDAQAMLSNLYALTDPVWLMSRAEGTDLTSITGWIPNGPLMLYGSDIELTLKQPALGTKGDVILADLGLYLIGDRGEIAIDVSYDEPTAMLKNQAVWRIVERVAGAPWINAPLTIPDGGTTQISPFVVLN